ncbi:MAG: alpha/beta hydrolase [Alphaproteobacteria bacterium]
MFKDETVSFLPRPEGERIAYRRIAGLGPGILWLSGFKSDMSGLKAEHMAGVAAREGIAFTAFDYYGHGASSGDFAQGTIGHWREDALAVLDEVAPEAQILVGSSMGGWIALLVALARPARVRGLVLIAPATDFTEDLLWSHAEIREAILQKGYWTRPSAYGLAPYPITRELVEEARAHLLLRAPIGISAPVHILHGTKDPDIPWERSRLLAERLASARPIVDFIEAGDHRLSTPADLARLERAVLALANQDRGRTS